ncbi:MAG: YIP1 family protein [Bacteroidota bacterium]
MNNGEFSISKLYEDSRKVLLRPKEYFASMEMQGGIGEPLVKALAYGVIAGVFVFIWNLLNVTTASTGFLGGASAIGGFFGAIIGAVVGVFIGGAIVLLISAICKGNTDFEPNMRVAAATMVLFPINAFLGFFGGISYSLGGIISLAISLYGVYMIYIAVSSTLQGQAQTARTVSYVIGAILILFQIV